MNTGDYTLEGYEDVVCIERKKSTGELAQNIGAKHVPFYKEMERMKAFPYRYLVLEFSESQVAVFPTDSGIPYRLQGKVRISANYLLSSIDRIRNEYDVDVIFANDRNGAIQCALEIFDKVINENGVRRTIF
jgi:hypothetical protein